MSPHSNQSLWKGPKTMSRSVFVASIAAIALTAAGSASAQVVTGTVTLNGTVAPKCAVTAGGGGAVFSDTVNLGELAGADGLLLPALGASTAGAATSTSSFTLKCTGANVGISVTSTALDNTSTASAPSGYTETVNFLGRATFDLVGASPSTFVEDDSAVAGASTGSFGAGSFLANTANNVRVSAYTFNTAPAAVLLAGGYTGQIVVVLTPI